MVITTQQNSPLGKCWKQFWATSEGWNKLVYCYSFFGILFNADQHFTKKVNITGLGLIGNVKYMIERKRKSQSISHGGSSTQCDEIFSLCSYAERGSRNQNFPEPIFLGNVVSSTHLSNDSSSCKANKQTKFNMQSFTVW